MMGDYVPSSAFKVLYPNGDPVDAEIEGYPLDQLARADFLGFELVDAACFRLVFQLRPPGGEAQRTSTGQHRGVDDLAVDDGGHLRPLRPGDVVEGVQLPGRVRGTVDRIRIAGNGALIVEIQSQTDGLVLIEVPRWQQYIHGDWAWKVAGT